MSRNYDGLQNDLEKMDGLFIARGSITDPVDYDAEWEFSPLAKVVLTLDMLFGRLELYPMLILMLPTTWTRRR